MKLLELKPDAEGIIRERYIVKFLGCKIIKGVPCVWAVQDLLGKNGTTLTVIVKENGDSVELEQLKHYITTLTSDEATYHLFEQPRKIDAETGQVFLG